jgi:hypothetical protein
MARFYCHAECRYAGCRYAECRYAECRGAISNVHYIIKISKTLNPGACAVKHSKLGRLLQSVTSILVKYFRARQGADP